VNPAPVEPSWESLQAILRESPPGAPLGLHARVARQVASLLADGRVPPQVERLRVAVLRSVTIEPLVPSLIAALAELGFAAEVRLGQLGALAQETLRDDSFVYAEAFDVCIVLVLLEHAVPGVASPGVSFTADTGTEVVEQVARLAERFRGQVIACNMVTPEPRLAARFQAQSPARGRYVAAHVNHRLAGLAVSHSNLAICDVESLAMEIGARAFWSPRDMASAMQPFSVEGLVRVGRRLAELCALARRTPVKCIVLDCDNTLWGGIVGEDGLTGIQLGETYPGSCYRYFQRQLLELSELGFLLAINSKNNEADVRAVFEQHPGMVLPLERVAALRVNWQDKVANLTELAEELNIGLDSFLFIDDSEFELDYVRRQLPRVRCLRTPEQPWRLPELLADEALDRLRIATEDRRKTEMYAQERQRERFKTQAGDLAAYLRGLDIHLTFEPFDPTRHLTRAAQLTQKTNQFNLTTRRYSEADFRALHERGALVYLASLRDRFGDYGRVALAVVQPADQAAALHVFLMSCRVIGRGIEESFLRLVMRRARQRGFERLEAEFIPSPRNAVCRDFLARAGLSEVARDADGRMRYTYDLRVDPAPAAEWLTVHTEGAADG
jgi:FkbH-like protein